MSKALLHQNVSCLLLLRMCPIPWGRSTQPLMAQVKLRRSDVVTWRLKRNPHHISNWNEHQVFHPSRNEWVAKVWFWGPSGLKSIEYHWIINDIISLNLPHSNGMFQLYSNRISLAWSVGQATLKTLRHQNVSTGPWSVCVCGKQCKQLLRSCNPGTLETTTCSTFCDHSRKEPGMDI